MLMDITPLKWLFDRLTNWFNHVVKNRELFWFNQMVKVFFNGKYPAVPMASIPAMLLLEKARCANARSCVNRPLLHGVWEFGRIGVLGNFGLSMGLYQFIG